MAGMRDIRPDDVVTEIGRSNFPQSGTNNPAMSLEEIANKTAAAVSYANNQAAQAQKVQEQIKTTEQILAERGKVYGDFAGHARVTQSLKRVFIEHMQHHNPEGYKIFISNPSAFEGMAMIFHKLGRIANGDPLYKDTWNDIAGYAKLVVDDLEF